MNENDLRQAFALMLTVGLGIDNADINPKSVWKIADALVAAQHESKEEIGIVAVKRVRKSNEKRDA
jgi:hypothetical protein